MSHNITATDTTAFVGQPAWHQLGHLLPEDTPARSDWALACKAAELEWRVGMMPIQVAPLIDDCGFEDDDPRKPLQCLIEGHYVPEKFVTFREDTGEIFNVVGRNYHPFQNEKVFQWFQPMLDTGEVEFTSMGSLCGGKTIWAAAKFTNNASGEVVPGDVIEYYLALITSHSGEFKNQCLMTPTRIVCQNTLNIARSNGQMMSWKHTKNQEKNAELVREVINTSKQQFDMTLEQYKLLAKKGIKLDAAVDYFKLVLGKDKEELATRSQNIIDSIVERMKSGAGAELAGQTLWGAYNAITNYTTHTAVADRDNRVISNLVGYNKKTASRALELAIQIATAA